MARFSKKICQEMERRRILATLGTRYFVDSNGCWIWKGPLDIHGYGIWTIGKIRGAHRVVYTFVRGPIKKGLTLDHLCQVTYCVNPDHLEIVTFIENSRRKAEWYRIRKKLLHDLT